MMRDCDLPMLDPDDPGEEYAFSRVIDAAIRAASRRFVEAGLRYLRARATGTAYSATAPWSPVPWSPLAPRRPLIAKYEAVADPVAEYEAQRRRATMRALWASPEYVAKQRAGHAAAMQRRRAGTGR